MKMMIIIMSSFYSLLRLHRAREPAEQQATGAQTRASSSLGLPLTVVQWFKTF